MAKKRKTSSKPDNQDISPLQALQFLEDMRNLTNDKNEPTVPISLRVPANLLRALKTQAKIQGSRYQSLIIRFIRKGLEK
jgi:predicted DNA binding CopG/RHH family protein